MGPMGDEDRDEVLDIRPEPPRQRVWLILACCLVIVGGGAVLWGLGRANQSGLVPSPSPSARTRPSATEHSSEPTASPSSSPAQRQKVPVDLGRLHATTDYSVFVRTDEAVYRIRPKAGTLTRTAVPALASTGPVSFVPFAGGVMVHPWDTVPGYVVGDDGRVRRLGDRGGILLPGPDSRHLWLDTDHDRMVLMGGDGRLASTTVRLPRGGSGVAFSDGQGYAIVQAPGGLYSVRPGGINRISNGHLLAAGPTRLLVTECDVHAVCHAVLLDEKFTTVKRLPSLDVSIHLTGVISPDGTTAALADQNMGLTLIDLRTGTSRAVPVRVAGGLPSASWAFGPGSQWLFVAGADGRARVVDVRTGAVRELATALRGVQQIAVRY